MAINTDDAELLIDSTMLQIAKYEDTVTQWCQVSLFHRESPGLEPYLPVSRWMNKISRYSRRTNRALRHKFRESKKM
jgi:hypothetical protein